MEMIDFGNGHVVAAHESHGVTAHPLARSTSASVTVLHVEEGGEIGRHPAPVDQLMVVTAGRGRVQSGSDDGDGVWQEVTAGQAVLWHAGEHHVTRAVEPLTAVVIEVTSPLAPAPSPR
ncbi:hypothetical protein [Actinoplanes sp. NBRC 101535]|uniref:cupin domain-containing protein n=1 Tax=Actinoplanes sp. NBRC 101535 TaxID=3032196 RepID=UPI0024A23515|nr:hypothetical protein [Actinoplanes sp. NBRC 101535]GLY07145.1 hypothetical protein Acsp01_75240 [Actinoplanes sp. NBRC 101535]